MAKTVKSWGTGKPDYTGRQHRIAIPQIEGGQRRFATNGNLTQPANTTTKWEVGSNVSEGHIRDIITAFVTWDTNTLMKVTLIDAVYGFEFDTKYGYGNTKHIIKKTQSITAGNNLQFKLTNYHSSDVHVNIGYKAVSSVV